MRIENGCLMYVIKTDILHGEFKFPQSEASNGFRAFISNLFFANLNGPVAPEGITSIGMGAFSGCTSLTRIDIPKNVTSIGDIAFAGCTNLTCINISENIMSIGTEAFYECESLTHIGIFAKTLEEFERVKSLLPENLRSKAKDINAAINEEVDKQLIVLEGLIFGTFDQDKEQEWADKVGFSIQTVQSMIDGIDNAYRRDKEHQKTLDSLVLRLYIEQGELNVAIEYFSCSPGVSSDAAFALASALIASNNLTKEKYQAIIHLFKEYDEDDHIHELLEKFALFILSNTDCILDKQIKDYGISRFLPCSAIMETISETKTLDKGLLKQFIAIENKLVLLTIQEIHGLLSATPLKEVFEAKYGYADIGMYESLMMVPAPDEIHNYSRHYVPTPNLTPTHLTEMLDGINIQERENNYKRITTNAVCLVKRNVGINAVHLLTRGNLGLFAPGPSSEKMADGMSNTLPGAKG